MNEEEIRKLYEDCYPKMVAYLIRVFGFSQDDAQDIASKAVLEEIASGGAKFDNKRGVPIAVWMVRKASFRAKDELRKRKRTRSYINIDEELGIEGNPGIETPQSQNRVKLIRSLGKELARVFELTSKGYTAEEIAAMLEMKVDQTRYLQRKMRAELVRLAKKLNFRPEDLFDGS